MTAHESETKTFIEQLRRSLGNEDLRYVYADTITNAFISAQIKALREERNLSQLELAKLIGTQQSGVSRLEKSDYSAWKVETLRKLAKAFHVRLSIRFEEFGTLIDEAGGFNDRDLCPERFEEDPVLNPSRDEQAVDETSDVYVAHKGSDDNTGDVFIRRGAQREQGDTPDMIGRKLYLEPNATASIPATASHDTNAPWSPRLSAESAIPAWSSRTIPMNCGVSAQAGIRSEHLPPSSAYRVPNNRAS